MIFPETTVALAAEPRWAKVTGRSGSSVERGFCPDCGSSVAMKLGMVPNVFGVQAGSLDEPARFVPAYDIFASSAHPWDATDPERPKKPHGMRD